MMVLGSWAMLNIFSGTAGYYLSENSTRYFHQMNAGWNLVNAGIAGMALYQLAHQDLNGMTYTQSLNDLQSLDRFLLLNTGLDFAYMATGAWLWERGLRKGSERLQGYGQALVVQGGFLLVFDLALYMLHHPLSQELMQLNDKLSLTATGFMIHF